MKNKIAIASAAFLAASSFSMGEIVINDFLSFEGFVDMSYSNTNADVDFLGNESDNSYGIDQVEIDWLFDFDVVTAQIDLAYEGSDGTQDTVVEQAFATYHLDNGGAVTAGRFASMLGFESFEPTGLYQYSFAYGIDPDGALSAISAGFADDFNGGVLPLYDQGVKYTYESESTFFGISLVDSVDTGRLGGDDDNSYGVEVAGAYDAGNGLSFFLGGRYDNAESSGTQMDQYLVDAYVTYETGAWLFAAEYVYAQDEFDGGSDIDVNQALVMANYAYSDAASVTGRVSYVNFDVFGDELEAFKYTLAHNYAFTDNLALVTEASYVDGDVDLGPGIDFNELSLAVELLFSF